LEEYEEDLIRPLSEYRYEGNRESLWKKEDREHVDPSKIKTLDFSSMRGLTGSREGRRSRGGSQRFRQQRSQGLMGVEDRNQPDVYCLSPNS